MFDNYFLEDFSMKKIIDAHGYVYEVMSDVERFIRKASGIGEDGGYIGGDIKIVIEVIDNCGD